MVVILVLCSLVAVSSLAALVIWRRGCTHLDRAGIAGLGALADAVAVVASLLAGLGLFGQGLLHGREGGMPALVVAAGCFVAQVVCMVVIRVSTRPRTIPRHITPSWDVPTDTTQFTVLLYDVKQTGSGLELEVFIPSGDLEVVPTVVDESRCRQLVGHRAVAFVRYGSTPVIVDLLDLGTSTDDESRPGSLHPANS